MTFLRAICYRANVLPHVRFHGCVRIPIKRYFLVNSFKNSKRSLKDILQQIRLPSSALTSTNKNNPLSNLIRCAAFSVTASISIFTGCIILKYENSHSSKHLSRQENNLFTSLTVAFFIVFLMTRNPSTPAWLLERFSSTPYSRHAGFAQLLSVFMHYSPMHLFFSVISVYNLLDMLKFMNKFECIALFLTAGINASLVSNLVKFISRIPTASVGASGAICGLAGTFCTFYPNVTLTIPVVEHFVPVQFSAASFLYSATLFELIGVFFFRYRSSIDHAAHLGGFLYGILFAKGYFFYWYEKSFGISIRRAWEGIKRTR